MTEVSGPPGSTSEGQSPVKSTNLVEDLSLRLIGLLILSTGLVFPRFWLIMPLGVSLLTGGLPLLWSTALSFGIGLLGLFLSAHMMNLVTVVDYLAIILSFVFGMTLVTLSHLKKNFLVITLSPFFIAFGAILTVCAMSLVLQPQVSYSDWAEIQLGSRVFPSTFSPSTWKSADLGEEALWLLKPLLTYGLLGFFSAYVCLSVLVSGFLENFIRQGFAQGFESSSPKAQPPTQEADVKPGSDLVVIGLRDHSIWTDFSNWKAPDLLLIPLFGGLLLLTGQSFELLGSSDWIRALSVNLVILGAFPIYIHGLALVSFLFPLLGALEMIILVLLLMNAHIQLPILMLAGLSDLLFDFRTKIRSNPEN